MSENVKTVTFAAIAALAVALTVFTRPAAPVSGDEDLVHKPLYPKFDPLSVTSMEIVEYDQHRGEVSTFRVAQADYKGKTRWSIPSHDDYPADAKDQVASAATGLMGLTPKAKQITPSQISLGTRRQPTPRFEEGVSRLSFNGKWPRDMAPTKTSWERPCPGECMKDPLLAALI